MEDRAYITKDRINITRKKAIAIIAKGRAGVGWSGSLITTSNQH